MAMRLELSRIFVPAVTSIVCALIASGVLIENSTVVVSDAHMEANREYKADHAGFVAAYAEGSVEAGERRVKLDGFIDGRRVASTVAADDTVGISISANSIFMPIRKGAIWRVDSNAGKQVTITWFAAEPKSWPW